MEGLGTSIANLEPCPFKGISMLFDLRERGVEGEGYIG